MSARWEPARTSAGRTLPPARSPAVVESTEVLHGGVRRKWPATAEAWRVAKRSAGRPRQAALHSPGGDLGAGGVAKLGEDVGDMRLDGALAYHQRLGDLTVGAAM